MNTEGPGGGVEQRDVGRDEADGLCDRSYGDRRRLNGRSLPNCRGDDACLRRVTAEVMNGVTASFKGEEGENEDEPKAGQPPA
jgi:hypothetical protein